MIWRLCEKSERKVMHYVVKKLTKHAKFFLHRKIRQSNAIGFCLRNDTTKIEFVESLWLSYHR